MGYGAGTPGSHCSGGCYVLYNPFLYNEIIFILIIIETCHVARSSKNTCHAYLVSSNHMYHLKLCSYRLREWTDESIWTLTI